MLPFSIKIVLAILAVLIILLFVVRKKKLIGILIILNISFGVWTGITEYYRTNKDISKVKADFIIPTTELIHQYDSNDSLSNKKYTGKVIETNGIVIEITKDEGGYYTIVLGDTASMTSIRCAMDSTHQQDASRQAVGASATVRGACTGFNKDEMGLGSDVILNRCVIVPNKK